MNPAAPNRRANGRQVRTTLVLAILASVAALGSFLLAPSPPPEVQGRPVRVAAVAINRPPAASAPTPSVVEVGLAGTWSTSDNGDDPGASCDLPSAITFLADGQYFTNGESGRYEVARGSITRFDRILYDIDAGEDRSQFDRRITEALTLSSRGSAQIGARVLFRCEKRAPEERRS